MKKFKAQDVHLDFVVLDENGQPLAGFSSEADLEYFVDIVEKSEGYTPEVLEYQARGNFWAKKE